MTILDSMTSIGSVKTNNVSNSNTQSSSNNGGGWNNLQGNNSSTDLIYIWCGGCPICGNRFPHLLGTRQESKLPKMNVIDISKTIAKLGNSVLRKKALPWTREELKDTKNIEKILETMHKEMTNSSGTGIAAPQIGLSKQLFLFQFIKDEGVACSEFPLTAFFNPSIELVEDDIIKKKPNQQVAGSSGNLLNLSRYKRSMMTDKVTTPKIQTPNNTISILESCLSVPNFFAKVNRARRCVIRFLDVTGAEHVIEAEGIIAACLQHEHDHLLGKLFVDRLGPDPFNQLVFTTELKDEDLQSVFSETGSFNIIK
eukprot:gene8592-10572_t